MKWPIALTPACFALWAVLLLGYVASLEARQTRSGSVQQAAAPSGQQAQSDDFDLLDAFLPGDKDPRDEDAKVMVMINCTVCHGPKDTKERISLRAGGDIVFWTGLIRKMNTSWNARIQEEDIAPIANYLTKYFGPAPKKGSGASGRRR
jgi:ketosteroid isomerase-like protein